MSILIIRLLSLINTAPIESSNYHIALTLLTNLDQIALLSISEVAHLCNVSKSKLSKFAKDLGFDDYLDLKDNSIFIENRFNNDFNYIDSILKYIQNNDIHAFKNILQNDIQTLFSDTYTKQFYRLAQDIAHYQKVAAFGTLFSEIGAIDLQYKLAYNGKYIVSFTDDMKQEKFINEADENTLIIVYSDTGVFIEKHVVRLGQPKKRSFENTKAKVVLITSNEKMKNHPFIDDSIIFPRTVKTVHTHGTLYTLINTLVTNEYRKLQLLKE